MPSTYKDDSFTFVNNLHANIIGPIVYSANNSYIPRVYTVDTVPNPTFSNLEITNNLDVSSISVFSLIINGDLDVKGTTTSINTINLDISDNLISLNNGLTGQPSNDSGILIYRGDASSAFMGWDESNNSFILGTTDASSTDIGTLDITPANLNVNTLVSHDLYVVGSTTSDTVYTTGGGYIVSNYDISNGFTGEFRFDASYIAICIDGSGSNNVWREIEFENLYQLSMSGEYLENTVSTVQTLAASITQAAAYVEEILGAAEGESVETILQDISGAIISANLSKNNLIVKIGDASNIIIDVSNAIAEVDAVFTNLDASLNDIATRLETQVLTNINTADISFNNISVNELLCGTLDVSGTLTGPTITRLDSSMGIVFTNVSSLDSSMGTVFNNVSNLDISMSVVENTLDVSGVTITSVDIQDPSGVYFSTDVSFNVTGPQSANISMDLSGNLIVKLNNHFFRYNVIDVSAGYNGVGTQ